MIRRFFFSNIKKYLTLKHKLFIIFLIVLIQSSFALSQWTSVVLPGNTQAIRKMKIIDKNNYFAITTRNLFSTTDNGATWDAAFLINHTINSFEAVDKNTLYLVGNEFVLNRGFLFKSTDGGFVWTQHYFSEGGLYSRSINDVAVSGNAIIVCGENGGIFKSTDGGENWVRCTFVSDEKTYGHLTFSDSTGYAMGSTGRNQGYDKVIYKSIDGGSSWDSIYYFPNGAIRELLAVTSETVYAAGQDSVYEAVYKTTDGGKTWTKVWKGLMRNSGLWSMYFVNENLGFIGAEEGSVYRTRDGGKTWNAIPTGAMPSIGMLCFYDEYFGFAAAGANLYQWDNSGKVAIIETASKLIFEKTSVGDSLEKELEIINMGDLHLELYSIGFIGNEDSLFSCDAELPIKIIPLGIETIKVKFKPKKSGKFNSTIVLESNASNSSKHEVQLEGIGAIPLNISGIESGGCATKQIDDYIFFADCEYLRSDFNYMVFDITGRLVCEGSSGNCIINLSSKNISAGIYIIVIDTPGNSQKQLIRIL